MSTAVLPPTSTISATWDISSPAPNATSNLNLDEGLTDELPYVPKDSGANDYVIAFDDTNLGTYRLQNNIPEDVGTVTAISFQFFHTGIAVGGPPKADFYCNYWDGSQYVLIGKQTINLLTSGYTASQIDFTGLSLTRDEVLTMAIRIDMLPHATPGDDPLVYDPEWGGD